MDKLQLLNNILIEPELSFNSISEKITNKTNINLAKDVLINMEFDNLIEYRSFLSIWIIKYCKNDIFQDEKINEYDTLIAICEKIIDNINSGINKDDIITLTKSFKDKSDPNYKFYVVESNHTILKTNQSYSS